MLTDTENKQPESDNLLDYVPVTPEMVICSVRALGAWITEETMALREDVVELLPYLLRIA